MAAILMSVMILGALCAGPQMGGVYPNHTRTCPLLQGHNERPSAAKTCEQPAAANCSTKFQHETPVQHPHLLFMVAKQGQISYSSCRTGQTVPYWLQL
jgi:hypothetical protein